MRILSTCAVVLLVALPAAAQISLPDPVIELESAPYADVSLFCTPSGDGDAWTAGRTAQGAVVDATLRIRLWDRAFDQPLAGYPREDVWLEGGADLAPCVGGTIADANVDADGRTQWTLPLRVGGWLDAAAGEQLVIRVGGGVVPGSQVPGISFNSPDLDGDGVVDIADLAILAREYVAGYAYRCDFERDGVLDLLDVVRFARTYTEACP